MIETIISNFNITRILYILKKSIIALVLFAAIGAALGGVYAQSQRSSTYRAQVSFYLYSKQDYMIDSGAYVNSNDFSYAKNLIQSYTLVLKSDTVLSKVIENAGLTMSSASLAGKIASSTADNTSVFYIYVYDNDPYVAMNIANSIAEVAPEEIAQVVKSGGITVIDYAKLPTTPYMSTNVLKYIMIGGVAGFGVLFVISMLVGLLDTTIRWKSELTNMFTLPILGEVPYIHLTKKQKPNEKIITDNSPFAMKEAYVSLCTNLLFTNNGENCPVYAVTSATQNEGKTLNSINIAKSLAMLGKKTLLIDADMRNASVARYLEMDADQNGLSNYLAGMDKSANVITCEGGLAVLPAGIQPPNPVQLLANNRFKELVDQAKKEYDYVIIDCPPMGIVSDALLLKDIVLGYLLIMRAGVSKSTNEKNILEELGTANAQVSGIVFNAVDVKNVSKYSGKYYGGIYSYGYGGDKKRK